MLTPLRPPLKRGAVSGGFPLFPQGQAQCQARNDKLRVWNDEENMKGQVATCPCFV